MENEDFSQERIRSRWQKKGSVYKPKNIDKQLGFLYDSMLINNTASVLEVGSGVGRVYKYIRKKGYTGEYTACDFVESMRIKHREATGIYPDYWDGKTLPYKSHKFDCSILSFILQHISSKLVDSVFSEVVRCTSGVIFVIDSSTVISSKMFLVNGVKMNKAYTNTDNNIVCWELLT